jgi:hypothetical protein
MITCNYNNIQNKWNGGREIQNTVIKSYEVKRRYNAVKS